MIYIRRNRFFVCLFCFVLLRMSALDIVKSDCALIRANGVGPSRASHAKIFAGNISSAIAIPCHYVCRLSS